MLKPVAQNRATETKTSDLSMPLEISNTIKKHAENKPQSLQISTLRNDRHRNLNLSFLLIATKADSKRSLTT